MRIAVGFTMKNLWHLTDAAIRSIRSVHGVHQTLVVDDWSDDFETLRWLSDTAPMLARVYTEPLTDSLAGKWNLLAEVAWASGADGIVICNNDILFHPVTLDALVYRYLQGGVGMVTAHNLRGQLEPENLLSYIPPSDPTESEGPDFSCFLLGKATWDAVGEFDPAFVPCYFEDNDYHYRMKQKGIKAITTTGAPYYHYGSRTQNSVAGGICRPPQFDENRRYFIRKHHVDPATYAPVTD